MTVLAISSCATSSVQVRHEFDPDASFGSARTFVWLGFQRRLGVSDFDAKRVANAIRAELASKGLTEVTDAVDADLIVTGNLGVLPKAVDTWKHDRGLLWSREGAVVGEGALVVDVYEPVAERLVWRGTAERQVDENATPTEVERNVSEVARRLLAPFPPER